MVKWIEAQSVSVSSVTDTNSGSTATMTLTTDYTVSGTTSTSANVGTYTVTITGQGNYTGTKTATWQITKANASVTNAPTAKTGLEGGTSNQLVNAGTASGGTIYYYCSTANTQPATTASGWSSSIPTKSDAGTYYVFYYVKGDSNHTDSSVGGPVTVTVANSDPGVALSASQEGYIVSSNGKAYPSSYKDSWESSFGTKAGVVTKKSSTSGQSYVVALYNCDGSEDSDGNTHDWISRAVALNTLTSVSGHSWIVGTEDQYKAALTDNWDTCTGYITSVGGRTLGNKYYWTSTQNRYFNRSNWYTGSNDGYYYVRPLFAF